jgi:hypothetical protein
MPSAHRLLDDGDLVGRVVDDEIAREPIFGASRRSSRAQSAWNVESHTPEASSPMRRPTRSRISCGRLVRERDGEDLVRRGVPSPMRWRSGS